MPAKAELKIEISEVTRTTFRNIMIGKRLQHHISCIFCKVAKGIGIIIWWRKFHNSEFLRSLYCAFIYPNPMCCKHISGNACSVYVRKWMYYKKVVPTMAGVKPRTLIDNPFDNLNIRRRSALNIFNCLSDVSSVYFRCYLCISMLVYFKQKYPYAPGSQIISTLHCIINILAKPVSVIGKQSFAIMS